LFPKFITAVICSGVATTLLAVNTLLRSQSRVGNVTIARLVMLVGIIAIPLILIESLLFRRVVLLEPFGEIMPSVMKLFHLG
jgi:hypothetical protein